MWQTVDYRLAMDGAVTADTTSPEETADDTDSHDKS